MIIDRRKLGTTLEGVVYTTTSQLAWDLACQVVYHESYEDTDWTILSSTVTGNCLVVVLMDLYNGDIYIETVELFELYGRIIDNRLAEEARQLKRARGDISFIDTEIISIRVINGMLRYQVRWSYEEGRPTRRRNVSFVDTGSLVL